MSAVAAFNEEGQKFFHRARNEALNVEQEFAEQQKLYAKFADNYAQVRSEGGFQGPKRISEAIYGLLGESKDAKILDYGCGIRPVADILIDKYGFCNIDGTEPCKELLDIAKRRHKMNNLFKIGSHDDHSIMGSKQYDLICSSGVFFATPSHPGISCIRSLCELTKSEGWIVLCMAESYLTAQIMEGFEHLEREGCIKMFSIHIFEGYRKSTPQEQSQGMTIKGAIVKMQVA
ncbi:uncharacterized protein [Clytia hemisphaerica]